MTYEFALAVAELAARSLDDWRPTKGASRNMRAPAVIALRTLWKSGDRSTRRLVVARVHVWLETPGARCNAAYNRV